MSPPPIAAVFLDFAGTLFSERDLRDVHLAQLRFVASTMGVARSDDELRKAYREGMGIAYRSIAVKPFYSHRELFGAAFEAMAGALGGTIDRATAMAAVDRQYAATLDAAALRPDCLSTLETLRAEGLHLQIVSNIDDEQLEGLLDRLALRGMLDAATSSESAGSCKPDRGIYEYALAQACCAPSAVLFVGDSLHHDVAGPVALGMRTAWLTADPKAGSAAVRPTYVIASLSELPGLIRQAGAQRP